MTETPSTSKSSTIIDFLSGISHDTQAPGASVSMIMPDGTPSAGSPCTAGGLYMPWGIAVDGNDMVVFIGLAAPVKTPLIGPPRKP